MNQSRSTLKLIFQIFLSFLIVSQDIWAYSSTEKNIQEKEDIIKQAKDALRNNLSTSERMNQLSNIVISYYQEMPDSALVYAQKMEPLIDEVEKKELLYYCDSLLIAVTNNFISKGLLNHAEPIAESILKISKKLKDKKLEARIVQNLIRINGMQRDLETAKTYAITGVSLFKELKDTLNYSRTITNLGNIEQFMGNYLKATELFFEALEIYKKENNKDGIANCYNSISLAILASGDLKKSEQYLENAFEIYKEIDNKIGIGNYYINKGNIQHKYYKKDSSINYLNEMLLYYQKAYDQFDELKLKTKSNMALGNIGTAYWKLGEHKKAIKVLQEVIAFNEKNSKLSSHSIYYSLGICYDEIGDYNKAITYIEKSINIQLKGKTNNRLEKSYLKLSQVYQKIGDTKNALRTQNLAYQNLDSFVKDSNMKNLVEIERKYKTIENEKKLIQQSLEIEQNNNALSRRKWGLVSLGVITTILGMGMISYFRKNKRIKKLNESLEQKNKFIGTLNKEINHRAKNHFQFISNLLRMQSKRLNDENAVLALEESEHRIQAMSIVYNKLLAKNNNSNSTIIFSDYITELVYNLEYTFQEINLKIHPEIANIVIDAELAAHFGILINELITNAAKHAFKNQPNPNITINFKDHEEFYHLELVDNGNGTPELINDNNHSSFGIQLIQIMTEQLKGTLNISKTNNGLNFSFRFKKQPLFTNF